MLSLTYIWPKLTHAAISHGLFATAKLLVYFVEYMHVVSETLIYVDIY